MSLSCDVGTYNLVVCKRDENNNFTYNREINAFLEIKLQDRFLFNIMKSKDVPLIERAEDGIAYVLGEAAMKMAYTMPNLELRRPMSHGCVNPKEKDAFEILNIMIHGLIENVKSDNEILYYTVPANAINEETDSDYHSQLLGAIFNAYRSETGRKVSAHPINEALALIYAELGDKNYTGISASCGSGMINVCFAVFGVPAFQFALVNSGDWIDKMAAKATGENPTFINQEKMKIDLTLPPKTLVERAIQTQYRIMIEKTVQGIQKGISEAGKKARTDHPIDVIVAGGTSLPNGFDKLFSEVLKQAKLPIELGTVVRPPDALYSVARGALIAAENATK